MEPQHEFTSTNPTTYTCLLDTLVHYDNYPVRYSPSHHPLRPPHLNLIRTQETAVSRGAFEELLALHPAVAHTPKFNTN